MDKRADRGMSGKMAGKTVKRVGTDSGIGSRKGVKGDKGGVKGGGRDRGRGNVKDGVKDRVRDNVKDRMKDNIKDNIKDSKHKVRDGEGKNGAGESGKRFDGYEGAVEKNAGMAVHQGYAKGRKDCQSLKNKMEGLLMLKSEERIPKEEAHMGDGEADGATVSVRC